MTDYFKEAQELKDELVKDRRHIHQNPELGLELPDTKTYVMDAFRDVYLLHL